VRNPEVWSYEVNLSRWLQEDQEMSILNWTFKNLGGSVYWSSKEDHRCWMLERCGPLICEPSRSSLVRRWEDLEGITVKNPEARSSRSKEHQSSLLVWRLGDSCCCELKTPKARSRESSKP